MARNLSLDQHLCFAVYAAQHAFNRFYKPLLGPLGLTYPQYLVLVVLWEEDGQTVTGIGDRLMLDSGTLTPLLKRLESAGFVSRARSTSDERQVLVRLTEAGQALRQEAEKFPELLLDSSGCTAESAQSLQRQLTELRARLDAAA